MYRNYDVFSFCLIRSIYQFTLRLMLSSDMTFGFYPIFSSAFEMFISEVINNETEVIPKVEESRKPA
jgi:hypothetical protein